MNPFDCLVEDIFCNSDLTEEITFNGRIIRAGVSSIAFAPEVTDFGADGGVSFYLTVRKADAEGIRRGSLVQYRGENYKVERTELDSAGRTLNVYLRSLSSR